MRRLKVLLDLQSTVEMSNFYYKSVYFIKQRPERPFSIIKWDPEHINQRIIYKNLRTVSSRPYSLTWVSQGLESETDTFLYRPFVVLVPRCRSSSTR